MTENYKEYRKRLLYEPSSSLRELEQLRMNDPIVASALSYHFSDDEETTFETTLINIIKILCDQKEEMSLELQKVCHTTSLYSL